MERISSAAGHFPVQALDPHAVSATLGSGQLVGIGVSPSTGLEFFPVAGGGDALYS
jgi:hypothetical protein